MSDERELESFEDWHKRVKWPSLPSAFQAGAEWQRSQQSAPTGHVMVPVEPTPEMIKAMRKKHWEIRGCQLCEQDYRDIHVAMLAAALSAPSHGEQVREGWKLVPVDMTQEMYLVFCEERGKHGGTFRSAYKAMLSAAPSAPATVQGDGWIPVSERLPNIVQEVIVNSEFDGITAGFLDSYGEWYSPNSDYKLKRVVAWQPLPAPPAIAAAPKAEQPPVQEPAAQVSIDADGGNKRLTWYSHKAMRETPEWTKLYAAPQPVSDDALMSAVEDVIDHLNGGFSIHSGQGLHSCLEAAYRAAMGSKGE